MLESRIHQGPGIAYALPYELKPLSATTDFVLNPKYAGDLPPKFPTGFPHFIT
jgi:hypothetical protein